MQYIQYRPQDCIYRFSSSQSFESPRKRPNGMYTVYSGKNYTYINYCTTAANVKSHNFVEYIRYRFFFSEVAEKTSGSYRGNVKKWRSWKKLFFAGCTWCKKTEDEVIIWKRPLGKTRKKVCCIKFVAVFCFELSLYSLARNKRPS